MGYNDYFSEKDLLTAPVERAAFTDRQAYVCAELSKLAYFKFEGGHTFDEAEIAARAIIKDKATADKLVLALRPIIAGSAADMRHSEQALEKILNAAGFHLYETYDVRGTQAFICYRDIPLAAGDSHQKRVAYLVYRGTELNKINDIITDLKFPLTKAAELDYSKPQNKDVLFHSGFYEAYTRVKADIIRDLDAMKYDQLFVTGHSLGGALAMVTTRLLPYEIKGACYTFGAPPIGTVEIQNGLKTPIYELVNETDMVPTLPNPWMGIVIKSLLKLIFFLLRRITVLSDLLLGSTWDEKLLQWLDEATRFAHPGYVSYLVGSGDQVKLRYSLSCWRKLGLWFKGFGDGFKAKVLKSVGNHAIDLYIEKLVAHAKSKNPDV